MTNGSDGAGVVLCAAVFVRALGVPDAYVGNGRDVEVWVSPPGSALEAAVFVPIAEALDWAADVYAAVTLAVRDHTGDPGVMGLDDLAALPDPGRLVAKRLAERWEDPA